MEIKTKQLLNSDVIQSNIDVYLQIRNSGEEKKWDEQYKWDILKKANQDFFDETLNKENILDKIEILKKYNPQSGSFVHWSNLDDFKKTAKKDPERVVALLQELFKSKKSIGAVIDNFRAEIKKINPDAKLGTPLFGYLLAVLDYDKYPIYKDSTFLYIKDILGKRESWKSMTIGEKYQTFSELCYKMGSILKPQLETIAISNVLVKSGIRALDGQDFFYILEDVKNKIQYWTITAGEDSNMWNEWIKNSVVGIKWSTIGDITQYDSEESIREALIQKYNYRGSVKNNALACFEFAHKMQIGDVVFAKKNSSEFVGRGTITSDYIFDENRVKYKHIRKIEWKKTGSWNYKDVYEKDGAARKTLTEITEYKDFIKNINNLISGDNYKLKIKNNIMISKAKNIILYGPPGTGKTYNTVNKALEIIDPEFFQENNGDRDALKKKFTHLQKEGHIDFVTFHQSYGYEEFVEGIKAKTTDNEQITYEIVDGIFKKIAIEALFDNLEFESFEEDLAYTELYDMLIKSFKEVGELNLKSKDGKEIKIKETSKRDNLYCYHGDSKVRHTVGKERLKKLYDQYNNLEELGNLSGFHREFSDIIGGADQTVYWAVLNELLKYKEEMKEENFDNEVVREDIEYDKKREMIESTQKRKFRDDAKKYILIIDEINRGNISKIFGELITLIEDSKRAGASDETIVQLPYSSEKFVVPSNLYIIGTMNTSDRSIALLDTALRRRFGFEEMMPQTDIDEISINVEGINVQEMLKKINERIEVLFDRDHMIGHAYFIDIKEKDELDNVMKHKIIPLLQEYFYDDWEKIQIVLGDAKEQENILGEEHTIKDVNRFVASEKYDKNVLGFEYDEIDEDEKIFKINETFTNQAYTKIYGDI